MKHDKSMPSAAAPLDQRIDAIENRIALRQATASTHRAELQRAIRNRLTSPLTLLLAAGAGFAIGQLARPRADVDDSDPATSKPNIPSLVPTLLSVMSLIGPVTALMARFKSKERPTTDATTRSA